MSASLANGALRAYNGSTKLSSYAIKLGLHDNTAERMFQRGQIAGSQLPTGTVIIEERWEWQECEMRSWAPAGCLGAGVFKREQEEPVSRASAPGWMAADVPKGRRNK